MDQMILANEQRERLVQETALLLDPNASVSWNANTSLPEPVHNTPRTPQPVQGLLKLWSGARRPREAGNREGENSGGDMETGEINPTFMRSVTKSTSMQGKSIISRAGSKSLLMGKSMSRLGSAKEGNTIASARKDHVSDVQSTEATEGPPLPEPPAVQHEHGERELPLSSLPTLMTAPPKIFFNGRVFAAPLAGPDAVGLAILDPSRTVEMDCVCRGREQHTSGTGGEVRIAGTSTVSVGRNMQDRTVVVLREKGLECRAGTVDNRLLPQHWQLVRVVLSAHASFVVDAQENCQCTSNDLITTLPSLPIPALDIHQALTATLEHIMGPPVTCPASSCRCFAGRGQWEGEIFCKSHNALCLCLVL